jgi:hypothetical protein
VSLSRRWATEHGSGLLHSITYNRGDDEPVLTDCRRFIVGYAVSYWLDATNHPHESRDCPFVDTSMQCDDCRAARILMP